jgi:hypothetical protein
MNLTVMLVTEILERERERERDSDIQTQREYRVYRPSELAPDGERDKI